MASFIPRYDPSDPKQPESVVVPRVKPIKDMSPFSSGIGMALSAAAMFTRIPILAFVALFFSVMSMINGSDIPSNDSSSSSPWTGIMMATTALANVYIAKFVAPTKLPATAVQPSPAV